ncbi:G-type lectin S-receptor-like serine/threonine-protein kinase RLK1 [Prosopis cineraria]|uniref:G-type lectin S-receptor-like serine/threonine-protein kinase RLK1 n=1 Tax=Prosopis cineraria TaxID=364024 RepID=UPI00240FE446|nr:G-type lectin S-receptor-like serine/threonine-protein kinase RLK1 [Prosopis cineraria]
MFLDCKQINNDICETSSDPQVLYNVTYMTKLQWRTSPYLVMPSEREACEMSCLEDCNCGAALYKNGSCEKYKLPLQYGRHNVQNASGTAIFKTPLRNKTTTDYPISFERKFHIDDKKSLILTLLLTLGSISFISLVFAMSIFFFYKHQVYSYTKLSESANLMRFNEDCCLRTFSFDELVNLTGNFEEEIGRGSFGIVYKGAICGCNKRIAVKKLDVVVDEGEREFQAEITAIGRTHHRNLVKLIGYCIEGSNKLLVYEYMSNGSLADFLFKAEMRLSWGQRVKIALDVARAILYLHEECEVVLSIAILSHIIYLWMKCGLQNYLILDLQG